MSTEALDLADLLEIADREMVTGLQGPKDTEALLVGDRLAEVLALGASLEDLDPRAAAGIEFLCDRIRTCFTAPALASGSTEQFIQLWAEVSATVLRLVDVVVVCLHEATRAHPSKLIARRLDHADHAAVAKMSQVFAEHSQPSVAERLQQAQSLIDAARLTLKQLPNDALTVRWMKSFHVGILVWVLGVHLCGEAAVRLSGLVNDTRPDFAQDAVEFANSGARLTGLTATVLAGLQLEATVVETRGVLTNTAFVEFLLRITREIPRVFGPDAQYRLGLFRYPDEPEAWELHLTIDSPLEPERARDQLDRLYDEFWDEAAAAFDLAIYPVLGVIDRG